MKCHSARGASLAILLAALTGTAWCQDTSLPSLFPLPPLPPVTSGYPVSRAAANDPLWGDNQISPVQTSPAQLSPMQQGAVQKDQSVISPEYTEAMKGGYESCSTCYGGGCNRGCGYYVYANALLMSSLKQGGQVVATDSITGNQRLNYCNQEFGNIWRGGFEVGTGYCFNNCCGGCGCCPNAIEMVYWGLYPGTTTVTALDNTNSVLNFGDLRYNDGTNANQNANQAFQNDELQRIQQSFSFNSVEINLIGNCNSSGPFGCGMCGCCCNGACGGRLGFGYTAGFRYMNFFDRFLYTGDPTFDLSNPAALNYLVATTNNLFGFQLGGGLQYCVTDRLRVFAIGKAGIYDNGVTALQRVYGTQGNAVIAAGLPNAGQDFVVRSATRGTLATSGQIDLGGRWAVTNNWSIQGGYRVLGLAGVATTDINIHNQNFHDVQGIASVNRFGSFVVHGFFAGATYCF